MGSPLFLILLGVPVAACGDAASRDRALTQSVAAQFRKECEQKAQLDGPLRGHSRRLCACGEARIAAATIRFGESDASISRKVEAATRACSEELGGGSRDKARP